MEHGKKPKFAQDPGSPGASWFERNPKKTIVLVVGCFVVLLDLVLAPFFAERIPYIKNQYYHHDLVANYQGGIQWGAQQYIIHTDSLGFKDSTNRRVTLSNDKYRLLFIGDSFMEGVGFPYEQTFVGLIDQQLPKANYEVLNAGVSSYSPKLYYLKVKYLIENVGLKFDELFVYFDISDVQDEIEYEGFQPSDSYLWAFFNRLNFWLKRHSFFCNVAINELIKIRRELLIRNIGSASEVKPPDSCVQETSSKEVMWKNQEEYLQYRGAWTYDDSTFRKWGSKGLTLAQDYLDKLYKLCQQHQIKLTIAVYPWPGEILHHNSNSKNIAVWQNFCKTRSITFFNCYPYFFTGEPAENIIARYYVPYDVHFNLKGHQLMARAWLDHFNTARVEDIGLSNQKTKTNN